MVNVWVRECLVYADYIRLDSQPCANREMHPDGSSGLPSTIVFIGFCIAFSIRDREIRNFRKFDKGLENLLSVLEGSFGPPRRLHLMSYQELCEQARKVLAEHAYSIHYAKVVRGEAEDMLLGSRTRLKFMYDGLRWYGLIPKGGYHPYYAEAEKRLVAEEAAGRVVAPQAAAPATSPSGSQVNFA